MKDVPYLHVDSVEEVRRNVLSLGNEDIGLLVANQGTEVCCKHYVYPTHALRWDGRWKGYAASSEWRCVPVATNEELEGAAFPAHRWLDHRCGNPIALRHLHPSRDMRYGVAVAREIGDVQLEESRELPLVGPFELMGTFDAKQLQVGLFRLLCAKR